MPTYTATDTVDNLNATTPSGADRPSELDDAIREIKLVLKTVMTKGHIANGCHKAFTYKAFSSTTIATGVINQWNRIALSTLNDPASLTSAGFTNCRTPIEGTYWVEFWVQGISCLTIQGRVAVASGNGTSPSASASVAELVGNVAYSNVQAYSRSMGSGLWTTDGTKSICLDCIVGQTGSIAQAIGTNGITGAYAGLSMFHLGVLP